MRADVEEFARLALVAPREGEALPWDAASRETGFPLPADYRAFVDAFGRGELYERLGVNTPFPLRNPSGGAHALRAFLDDAAETAGLLRGLRNDYPDAFPFAFHPEPGGLLPWGTGIGGELCFWLTEHTDPDGWPTVVWDKEEWRRYDLGAVGLLLLTVAGTDPFLRELFFDEGAPVWLPDE